MSHSRMTVSQDRPASDASPLPRRTALWPLIAVTAHAWVVLAVLGFFTVVDAARVVGANIGAALVLLVVGAIGLPWSLLDLLGAWPRHGGHQVEIAFLASSAVFNLVLHATAAAVYAGRLGRSRV